MLDPFSETEVADYIAQRSPSLARDEAFVRALHERTDGVPLFVSSVITEVMERTDDGAAAQARLAAVAVPENLAAIIDHYIARLGSEQRALLAAAAVCGVEFRVDTLALALGRDIASVALACDELVREHVWLAAPRAGEGERCDWSCRIRSGMRCSARCCTTARRRPRACSCTATWARPSNASAPPAWRFRPRSWRCISTAGGSRWPRCATTPRRPKRRC